MNTNHNNELDVSSSEENENPPFPPENSTPFSAEAEKKPVSDIDISSSLVEPFSLSETDVLKIEELLLSIKNKKESVDEVVGSSERGSLFSVEDFGELFGKYAHKQEEGIAEILLGSEGGLPLEEEEGVSCIVSSYKEHLLLSELSSFVASLEDEATLATLIKDSKPFDILQFTSSFMDTDNLLVPFYELMCSTFPPDSDELHAFEKIMKEAITLRLYSEDIFEVFPFRRE